MVKKKYNQRINGGIEESNRYFDIKLRKEGKSFVITIPKWFCEWHNFKDKDIVMFKFENIRFRNNGKK